MVKSVQTNVNLWIHDLFITHHITCTDTGLKTWVRPAVFTVKPLWCKHNCWSFPQRRIVFHHDWIRVCNRGLVTVWTHPSPSRWIFVSLHRGNTIPIEQLLLERGKENNVCSDNSTCANHGPTRPPVFSSPVFVGEVNSQQDVLFCVLPPAGVHHHHVAHAIRPCTLQPHRLDGRKANRRRVNNHGNKLKHKKKVWNDANLIRYSWIAVFVSPSCSGLSKSAQQLCLVVCHTWMCKNTGGQLWCV